MTEIKKSFMILIILKEKGILIVDIILTVLPIVEFTFSFGDETSLAAVCSRPVDKRKMVQKRAQNKLDFKIGLKPTQKG